MKKRFFAALRMTVLTVAIIMASAPKASAQWATFDASNLAQAVLSFLQDGDNMVLNTEQFLENLENYCAGRPLAHLVDREAGY